MAEAQVNRILAPSFLDGPGSRMAIFLQGCDLRCGHCHNPETWRPCSACGACVPDCPGGALAIREGRMAHAPDRCRGCDRCLETCREHASPRVRTFTVEALLDTARPWVPYLDGITFSGGECTLQADFLQACLPRLRGELGLPSLLDTNGNLEPDRLEALLPLCEGLLFDLKVLDPAVHRALTGADNGRILANLDRAARAGKLTEIRTVLLPGVNDAPEQVRSLAVRVAALGGVPLRLSPFRPLGVRGPWAQVPALDPAAFAHLCDTAREVLGGLLKRGGSPE